MVHGIAKPGDYVVCLGAGNITQWAYALPGELEGARGRRVRPLARCESGVAPIGHDLFPTSSRPQGAHGPICAAGCMANEPLAPLTWFRVGGPAQVLFTPADEDDLAYFLATSAGGHSGHRRRRRLQPDRARRRRAGRRDPLGARGFGEITRRGRRDPRRRGGARQARRGRRRRRRHRRAGILLRHSRHHRRRAAHERRRQWRRDQGRAGRSHRHRPRRLAARVPQRRDAAVLSQQWRRPDGHLHLGAAARRDHAARDHPGEDGRGAAASRDQRSRSAKRPAARPSRIRRGTAPGS